MRFGRGLPKLNGPLWVLLSGIFATHFGYYMLLPFLAVALSRRLDLNPAQVGAVLGSASFAYLGGSIAGGWLADRVGRRAVMLLGLGLRTVGLIGYGLLPSLPAVFAAAVATGAGGSLYNPSAKAEIAARVSAANRTTAFSLRGVAANVGTTLGPLAGAALIGRAGAAAFWAAGLVHAALAAITWLGYPADGPADRPAAAAVTKAERRGRLAALVADPPFLVFSLVSVAIWGLYAQLTFSLPLRAAEILPRPETVGLLWTISSILVIGLQVPVTEQVTRRLHPLTALALGVALIGAGLGSVAGATGFAHLAVSVLVFTAGEMLVMPTIDSIVSQLARPETLGTYFGVAALVWGLGEGLGNLAGGQAMAAAAARGSPALPWGVFAIAAALLALVVLAVRRWPAMRRAMRAGAARGMADGPRSSPLPAPPASALAEFADDVDPDSRPPR